MISLTPVARTKIQSLLNNRKSATYGIRIGVKTTGCSGYAYVFEYCDALMENDADTDIDGIHIVIDRKYVEMLSGMAIDYTKEGLNEGFKFINPNERDRCGCGSSFRV